MWASEYKYHEVVRRLLARGANPHLRDKEQNTALHWAAFSGTADTISQLLHAKCEIDALNERGRLSWYELDRVAGVGMIISC